MYSNWANANLASITEAVDVNGQEGSDWGIGIAYGILVNAGDSGATTATIAISEEEANWCIALLPAAEEPPSGTIVPQCMYHYTSNEQ